MSNKQQRVFWPGLTLIVLALTAFVFVPARVSTVASSRVKPASAMAAQRNLPEFRQRIRVWIHGDDVRPRVIHSWPGKALITIQNETAADVSLQVERVLPNRTLPIGTVNLPGGSKRLQHEIVLAPGEYVFYEASRPTIRGQLIVEPRE